MLKHVGRHGDRKVVVIFRELPGEPNAALVVYTEILPRALHDAVIKCVESNSAQCADTLADVLHREVLPNGNLALETLHKEGFLKRVQTMNIIMTPTVNTTVRLDELNKIIRELKAGSEAAKRMEELDKNAGLRKYITSEDVVSGNIADKINSQVNTNDGQQTDMPLLDDSAIARSKIEQAKRFSVEAERLMAESAKLLEEAAQLDPSVSKPSVPEQPAVTAVKSRGRPTKKKVTNGA